MQGKTLQELADHVGGKLIGDGNIIIKSAATLSSATEGDISFVSNRKYIKEIKTTKASAVIVKKELESDTNLIISDDPYYALTEIMVLLHGHRKHPQTDISQKASIAKTAKIGQNCHIADFATISQNVSIGDNTVIYPGAFIGENATIGNDCIIYPNAVVYDFCVLGDRVILQAGAIIGQDGFGFATHNGIHHKIPQIGRVILENDVEIGSCATIERGALDDTIIGAGSKLGDQVVIGHGVKTGPGCLLVPQAGVAGSSTLGHHVVLGGQVGVAGHIKVGNMVMVAAKSGITGDVPDGRILAGTPAIDAYAAKKAYIQIEHLPDIKRKVKKLEEAITKLQDKD